jgi:hypothetical protein
MSNNSFKENELSKNDEKYKELIHRNDYSLITFIPSTNVIESTPVGYTGEKTLNQSMMYIDYSIHTPESCKLAVGLALSDYKYHQRQLINNEKTPGIKFKIAKGDFNKNPKYFLDSKNTISDFGTNGQATDFSNIKKATNNTGVIDTLKDGYSIEWYGVCIPDINGIWNFELNTNQNKMLWIGDKAIHNYNINNCDILDNDQFSMLLTAGQIYPIRIHYSYKKSEEETDMFQFNIRPPPQNSSNNQYYSILYTLKEEPKLIYYSLNELSPIFTQNNLFGCQITNPTNKLTDDKLRKIDFTQRNNTKPVLKSTDDVIYTNDSNRFLYSLNVDEKMNKMFYSNDQSFNLQNIPYNSDLLKPNGNYINVGDFFPPFDLIRNENLSKDIDKEKCETKCNNDPKCNYYYHGSFFNKKLCVLGNDNHSNNIIPVAHNRFFRYNESTVAEFKDFILPSPYSKYSINIKSSLYIKDKIIDMDKTLNKDNPIFLNKKENKIIIDNGAEYSKYQYNTMNTKSFNLDNRKKNDVKEYKEIQDTYDRLLYGTTGKQGFTTRTVEPFNTNDYNASECSSDLSGCIPNILDKKINPLNHVATQYSNTIDDTRAKSILLKDKILDVSGNFDQLKNNSLYYPLNKNKDSLSDGITEDMNELLLQENNMYILGALTTATLLITSIMFSMN